MSSCEILFGGAMNGNFLTPSHEGTKRWETLCSVPLSLLLLSLVADFFQNFFGNVDGQMWIAGHRDGDGVGGP